MATILSSYYSNGVDLSDPSLNPVTVTGTILLGTSVLGGALYGEPGVAWDVTNQGTISGQSGAGIELLAGGTVANAASASVSGYWGVLTEGSPGTVVNYGTIAASSGAGAAGVFLLQGGSVTNQTGGLIQSLSDGVKTGALKGPGTAAGAGTVVNAGTINAGTASAGIFLLAGGSVINQQGAQVLAGGDGIEAMYGAGTVQNAGTIDGGPTNGAGIYLLFGGSVTNQAGGQILSSGDGIEAVDTAGSVMNAGTIDAGANGVGIALFAGGSVTNTASGSVSGFFGVAITGSATGSVLNTGTIAGSGIRASGVYLTGGSVTNTASGSISGYFGVAIKGTATGSVLNDGSIAGSGSAASGVYLTGGTVTNQADGQIGGNWGVIVAGAAGTVVNDGTIVGTGGTAVLLPSGYANRVVWDPGAAFSGTVDGGSPSFGSILELSAGSATSNLYGLGTQFINFATVAIDTGADWTLQGTNNAASLVAQGELTIGSAATLSASYGVSAYGANSAAAQIVVTGSGLLNAGEFVVGDQAAGSLSVTAGGTVTAADLTVGAQSTGSGTVLVSGTGSDLDVAGTLNIGTALGTGELTIGPSAVVSANEAVLRGEVLDQGGTLDPNEIDVTPGNAVVGFGTVGATGDLIVNAGSIDAQAGGGPSQTTMTVVGTVVGSDTTLAAPGTGALQIGSGATLALDGSVDASQSVDFANATGVLALGDITGFAGTIASFFSGDTIIVNGVSVASDSLDQTGHTLSLFDASSALIGTLLFDPAVTASEVAAVGGVVGPLPCFAAGTRIMTVAGEKTVESLVAGDTVRTVLGGKPQPIVWIGHRSIDCSRHPQPRQVWPVRVAAGAFGRGLPARALYLSPDHAVYADGVLIPVKYLVNGETIAQVPCDSVTYYHLELPRHDVVLAEGLPAESYLDTGDRGNFANGGRPIALYPDFSSRVWEAEGCAELIVTGPKLDAVRARLARTAGGKRAARKRAA
jgi:T5SS/PEP-CTERM-associated repeat protein